MKSFISLVLCALVALTLACTARASPRAGGKKPDLQMGIFARNCTECHDLAKVEEAHKTKTNAEMREILKSHKGRDGFLVTEEDLKTLLELY